MTKKEPNTVREMGGPVPTGEEISASRYALSPQEEILIRLVTGKGLGPEEKILGRDQALEEGGHTEALAQLAAIEERAVETQEKIGEALEEAGMPGLPTVDGPIN